MKIQLPKISNILDPYQNDPTIFYDHYIQDTKFEKTVIQNIENQNMTIDACRFDHCEFENTHFLKCSLYRVQFINCRCMGIEISDSLLDNTLFDSCNNAYSNYGMSSFKKVRYENTNLENSGFIQCTFKDIEFKNVQLDDSDFFNTNLNKVDFSTCQINNIGVSENMLKGIIINTQQAMTFLKLLGIVVK